MASRIPTHFSKHTSAITRGAVASRPAPSPFSPGAPLSGAPVHARIGSLVGAVGPFEAASSTEHALVLLLGGFLVLFSLNPPVDVGVTAVGVAWIKYTFAAVFVGMGVALVVQYRVLNYAQLVLLLPLVLSAIGVVSLAATQFLHPGTTTYASALIPLIVCALPLFIPSGRLRVDGHAMLSLLIRMFGGAASLHLVWQVGAAVGAPIDPSHERTFIILFLMVLSGFGGSARWFVASLVLVAASEALRPSSTLALGSGVVLLSVLLYRAGYKRLMQGLAVAVMAGLIVVNLGVILSESFAERVYSIEPLVKVDLLGGISNNDFRLGVLSALREEMRTRPMLYGNGFAGDINPSVSDYLPWFGDEAPIHDDFLIMYSQGGLIGYALFAATFLGFAALCARSARLAERSGRAVFAQLFDSILVADLVFVLYISFNPILQKVEFSAFFLMLLPIAVLCRRMIRPGRIVP
jgi:hypothetical protein